MKKLWKANHIALAVLALALSVRVVIDEADKEREFYRGTYVQCKVDVPYYIPWAGFLYDVDAICNGNTFYAKRAEAYSDPFYSTGFVYPPEEQDPSDYILGDD